MIEGWFQLGIQIDSSYFQHQLTGAPASFFVLPVKSTPAGVGICISAAVVVKSLVLEREVTRARSTSRRARVCVHPLVSLVTTARPDVDRAPESRRICFGRGWVVIGEAVKDEREDAIGIS